MERGLRRSKVMDSESADATNERNYAVFREVLPELIKTYAGSFALMREGRIVQFFSTQLSAEAYGHQAFNDGLFSVLEVSEKLWNQPPPNPTDPDVAKLTADIVPAAPRPAPAPDNNPMRVIVFASQKGGAGKTTLCGQLAVQAELAGEGPVTLIDTDPQGSLAEWWNARTVDTPLFVKTQFVRLAEDLKTLRGQGIKLVFVDTPPAVTDTIREVVGHSDLVVIPTRPSPHDLRAVGATVDIIEDQKKPLIFAVNATTSRARITSEAAIALSQHGTVAPVTVHQRVDFATSMIDGRTVMEIDGGSRSAAEITGLWEYVSTRLSKLEPCKAQYQGPERRNNELPFEEPDRRIGNTGPVFGKRTVAPSFGRRDSH